MRIQQKPRPPKNEAQKPPRSGLIMAYTETYEAYRARKRSELKRADKALEGELCKQAREVVKAQAETVKTLLKDRSPKNIEKLRTEIERLIDYQDYETRCGE
jgi:hypothetical protein